MQFPNLPTDNLYKFLALSGVLVAVVSVYFVITTAYRSQELARLVEENIRISDVLIDFGEITLNSDAMQEALLVLAESTAEIQELNFIVDRKNTTIFIGLIVSFAGVVMSYFGFFLWYRRVQIYHDMILKHESESLLGEEAEKDS